MQRTVSHSLHADASNIKCKKLESEGKRPTTVCKKLKQQKLHNHETLYVDDYNGREIMEGARIMRIWYFVIKCFWNLEFKQQNWVSS